MGVNFANPTGWHTLDYATGARILPVRGSQVLGSISFLPSREKLQFPAQSSHIPRNSR